MDLTHESLKTVMQYFINNSASQINKRIWCLYNASAKGNHERKIIFENWQKLYPNFLAVSSKELESSIDSIKVLFSPINPHLLKGFSGVVMLCPDWHLYLSYEERYEILKEIGFINRRHNLNDPT